MKLKRSVLSSFLVGIMIWFTDKPCVSWIEFGAGSDFKAIDPAQANSDKLSIQIIDLK
jgi:hypothetical protein